MSRQVTCHLPDAHHIFVRAARLNDNNETVESKFYPFYNAIFHYWFPTSEGYDIYPQWPIAEGSRRTVDFTITFVIEHNMRPLMLVEIKPPSHFPVYSKRKAAIGQVHRRLNDVGPNNLHADRLYAISAIGKRWRACYALRGRGSKGGLPVRGIAEKSSLRSTSPECWNEDITSDASFEALKRIVNTIKRYVA